MSIFDNKKIGLFLLVAGFLLVSCGTSRKQAKALSAKPVAELTPEQQRKYDYFFLEAARLKIQKDYDAAFDLLQHCLTINPNASSALYELAQYYLFLKQVPQGQAALEKAVENDPDNYWYSQGLANLYQQQDEKEKAMKLLEDMSIRFTDKLDPLYALLDIYNRQEQYDKVIATLNRIEEKMGKSEQLSMEKFRIYLQMKDNKNAFHEIESLVAEYPMDSRYQVVLGDVYMQNGKKEEAYNMYRKVLDAEPDNAMAIASAVPSAAGSARTRSRCLRSGRRPGNSRPCPGFPAPSCAGKCAVPPAQEPCRAPPACGWARAAAPRP